MFIVGVVCEKSSGESVEHLLPYILGTRYLFVCVCIIWSNLGYAKNCATNVGTLAKKTHHHNRTKIWKEIPLCFVDNSEKEE